jgi:hypothetical protein
VIDRFELIKEPLISFMHYLFFKLGMNFFSTELSIRHHQPLQVDSRLHLIFWQWILCPVFACSPSAVEKIKLVMFHIEKQAQIKKVFLTLYFVFISVVWCRTAISALFSITTL